MTLPIGLTPPATPPHQMWKPIAPVSLLGKTKSEVLKPTPNKAIQIEARPLPSNMLCSKPQTPTTTPQTQPFSLDHDYCLPSKDPCQNEVGNRWNVKQQPSIIIKTVELPPNKPAQNSISKASTSPLVTEGTQINLRISQPSADKRCTSNSSALETPDASPNRPDSESSLLGEAKCNRQKFVNYSEHSSRQDRGRSKRRYRVRSSSSSESSSESSSRSCSPPRKRSALMWLCTYIMIRKECWQHHRSRGYCQTCIFTDTGLVTQAADPVPHLDLVPDPAQGHFPRPASESIQVHAPDRGAALDPDPSPLTSDKGVGIVIEGGHMFQCYVVSLRYY